MSHIRARSDGRRGLHGNLNLSHAQGTRQQRGGAGQRHYAMVVLGLNRLDEQQSSGRPLSKRPLSSPRACVRTDRVVPACGYIVSGPPAPRSLRRLVAY